MPSIGIDRRTGKALRGLDHVRQSVEVIFTTPIGSRVMRRTFGSAVPALLGREDLAPEALPRFLFAIWVAIEAWEPRLRVRRVIYPPAENTVDGARRGRLGMRVVCDYRPNALENDTLSDVVVIDL